MARTNELVPDVSPETYRRILGYDPFETPLLPTRLTRARDGRFDVDAEAKAAWKGLFERFVQNVFPVG